MSVKMKRRTVRTSKMQTSLEDYFNALRQDRDFHLGMGDVRITPAMQEEIEKLVMKQCFTLSIKCEQMLSFVKWYAATKDKSLVGKEEELIKEWDGQSP